MHGLAWLCPIAVRNLRILGFGVCDRGRGLAMYSPASIMRSGMSAVGAYEKRRRARISSPSDVGSGTHLASLNSSVRCWCCFAKGYS